MADETYRDDNIQHGIDDNPEGDAKKGAARGGIGGAAVGAAAGSMMGPLGAVGGAVLGGIAGAAGSGAAVGAVDKIDNDNNVTGLGDDVAYENDDDEYADREMLGASTTGGAAGTSGYQNVTATRPDQTGYGTAAPVESTMGGNQIPGIQTGGRAADGTPDTRGISEKAADAVTGDRIDDKTGKPIV